MGKPHAPQPPDPTATANAQSAANIASAQAQQKLNLINTSGPNGQVTFAADPNAPGGYSQTTSLNPTQQAIYDAINGLSLQQLGAVGGAVGKGVNTTGMTGLQYGADLSGLKPGQGIQKTFAPGQALRYDFNTGQPIQGAVGGDLEAARNQAIDASWNQARSRLDPMWREMDDRDQTRLANQGFSQNSTGYDNARGDFSRARNDAYDQALYGAVGAGEQAAQGQFGRQLAQGQFANQAAGQEFSQGLGAADFWNAVSGQDYGQNQGLAQFGNSAQQQGFGQQAQGAQLAQQNAQINNAARAQDFSERSYQQMLPFQQAALLQQLGNGVQMPTGFGYTPSQVGQTDVMGAYALNQQQQNANYQTAMQQQGGLMNGLFSLGAAALMAPMTGGTSLAGTLASKFSDRRLKTDVVHVGSFHGHNVYAYRYLGDDRQHLGVMAQEIANDNPEAVGVHPSGYLMVHYGRL